MPGTRSNRCSTRPGSAACSPPRCCARRGKTRWHLPCLHAGLKAIPRERRRAPPRDAAAQLVVQLEAITAAAAAGLNDHDRWLNQRTLLARKLDGRRATSKLPALLDYVLTRPIVSAGMIAAELGITPRAAQNLVAELGLARGDRTKTLSGMGDPVGRQSVRCPAAKQMPIAVLGHPVGAGEMGFPGAAGAVRLAVGIKVQHDPRNLFPIGAVGFGVEQAQIRDQVELVIAGQSGRSRRRVGDIWVERGFLHGRSGNESPRGKDTAVNTLSGRPAPRGA